MTEWCPNAQTAKTLVEALAASGIQHGVMSPGSRNTPLVLAFSTCATFELHSVVDERSAGFFALGLARASQQPVVLLCTSGSAGAHYLPAIIEAYKTQVPLVILTADRPKNLLHVGALQTINQQQLFGSHVQFFSDLGEPQTNTRFIRTQVAVALRAALKGPVHLNVPFVEPLWQPDKAIQNNQFLPAIQCLQGQKVLNKNQMLYVADKLQATQRGVIFCGPYAAENQEMQQAIIKLADHLKWPILAEASSQLRFTETPTIGTYDAFLRHAQTSEILKPDVVLQFGFTPTSKILQQWLTRYAQDKMILVGENIQDPNHLAMMSIDADITNMCEQFIQTLKPSTSAVWLQQWQNIDAHVQKIIKEDTAIWEGNIAKVVVDTLPEHASLHIANSMPIRDVDNFAQAHKPLKVFVNRGVSGIDGTLSSAIGEAVIHHDQPMVLLCGDLAFLHDIGGLSLAAQKIKLTVVLINNNGGGIFNFLPIQAHKTAFTPYFRTPQTDLNTRLLCKSFGVHYQEVTTLKELQQTLSERFKHQGLAVLEFRTDSDLNVQKHRELWQNISDHLGEYHVAIRKKL